LLRKNCSDPFSFTADAAPRTGKTRLELPKSHGVGKYGVDVAAIDRAADATLGPQRGVELYLVDEIGRMECLSERFVAHMRRILDSRVPLVATVAQRGTGFIAEVKRREDCELWTLTRANRDAMPRRLYARVEPRRR
jgi:nucleoside-triphosphatase